MLVPTTTHQTFRLQQLTKTKNANGFDNPKRVENIGSCCLSLLLHCCCCWVYLSSVLLKRTAAMQRAPDASTPRGRAEQCVCEGRIVRGPSVAREDNPEYYFTDLLVQKKQKQKKTSAALQSAKRAPLPSMVHAYLYEITPRRAIVPTRDGTADRPSRIRPVLTSTSSRRSQSWALIIYTHS